ncbi:WD40 repeat domain-containing protein [Mesorhizobium sp. M0663]
MSDDLSWLISVAEDGSSALWRFLPDWVPFVQDGALTGVKEPVFEKGDEAINYVRFSPDGSWISAKTEEGPILLGKQRADEPNQLPRLQAVGEGYFGTRSIFSDDSHWIASYGDLKLVSSGVGCPEEHSIFMKNIASQGEAEEFHLAEPAFDIRFSPGGKWLLAHVQQLLASDVCPIRSAILFRTAAGLQAGAVELKGDTFMFSENGRWLAVGKGDQTELLDLQRDNPKENPILLDGKLVGPQKYTMYGKIWQQDRIVIQNDYGASVIDISGDQPADVGINLEGTAERIAAADFSQDGKWLVTSDFHATRAWHLAGTGGSVEATAPLVSNTPSTVVFGSKKPWIATAALGGAQIFDLTNKAGAAPVELATGEASIASSPDECWLAASSTTGSVVALHLCGEKPWDRIVLQAGAADHVGGGAGSVAFNSASNLLSFSGNDGAIRVWDLRRQPLQQAILSDKMEGGTALVGFFPGEEGSLAILESGRLIRWSLETGRAMDLVSRVVNRDLTLAECSRYFSQADLLLIKSAIAGCPPTAP